MEKHVDKMRELVSALDVTEALEVGNHTDIVHPVFTVRHMMIYPINRLPFIDISRQKLGHAHRPMALPIHKEVDYLLPKRANTATPWNAIDFFEAAEAQEVER